MATGAWSKGANRAVATPPTNNAFQPAPGTAAAAGGTAGGRGSGGRGGGRGGGGGRNNNGNNNKNNNNNNNNKGGGGNRNRRQNNRGGGRGRGGDGDNNNNNSNNGNNNHHNNNNRNNNKNQNNNNHHHNNRNNKNQNNNNHHHNHQNSLRIFVKDVGLLENNGTGETPEQKEVRRIPAPLFLRLRLDYLEAPTGFATHEACHWVSDSRLEEIQATAAKARVGGDVSKKPNPNETAPPIEECKPLQIDEETRWKPKSMQAGVDESSTEEVVAKGLLILNKISWTTLDKLTEKFLEETKLTENGEVRQALIELLVNKSQMEPHFGPMYAQLCATISKQMKTFKKELLTQCQHEFDEDTAHKIARATEGVTDPEEIAYKSTIIRKAYIGHMKFLGELYKRDVVKLSIMIYCLDELLKDETDEENLECFANLMTTMGNKLDDHAKQNNKPFDWGQVEQLVKSKKISNRIKFLLQDLLELKDRGWVKRRQEETAKTIAQIHKEVAKEEQQAAMANKTNRRGSSSNNLSLRRSSSLASTPTVDDDGFVQITRGSMKKVRSKSDAINQMDKQQQFSPTLSQKNLVASSAPVLRRSQSQPASMSSSLPPESPATKRKEVAVLPTLPSEAPKLKLVSEEDCEKKTKSLLKEYFVGGDTDDAVLSVSELVAKGNDGSVGRGAKVIESGVFMVMEMKEVEVKKMMTVFIRCVKEDKFDLESIARGLNDPLDLLSDIEIDAPLAGNHLALIMSEFLKAEAVAFELLTKAPEYFLTSGKPAEFACKVLKSRGGEPSEAELTVVEQLMTEDDKKSHTSAKALFDA